MKTTTRKTTSKPVRNNVCAQPISSQSKSQQEQQQPKQPSVSAAPVNTYETQRMRELMALYNTLPTTSEAVSSLENISFIMAENNVPKSNTILPILEKEKRKVARKITNEIIDDWLHNNKQYLDMAVTNWQMVCF